MIFLLSICVCSKKMVYIYYILNIYKYITCEMTTKNADSFCNMSCAMQSDIRTSAHLQEKC